MTILAKILLLALAAALTLLTLPAQPRRAARVICAGATCALEAI
jgi:hypothetical protein